MWGDAERVFQDEKGEGVDAVASAYVLYGSEFIREEAGTSDASLSALLTPSRMNSLPQVRGRPGQGGVTITVGVAEGCESDVSG